MTKIMSLDNFQGEKIENEDFVESYLSKLEVVILGGKKYFGKKVFINGKSFLELYEIGINNVSFVGYSFFINSSGKFPIIGKREFIIKLINGNGKLDIMFGKELLLTNLSYCGETGEVIFKKVDNIKEDIIYNNGKFYKIIGLGVNLKFKEIKNKQKIKIYMKNTYF